MLTYPASPPRLRLAPVPRPGGQIHLGLAVVGYRLVAGICIQSLCSLDVKYIVYYNGLPHLGLGA